MTSNLVFKTEKDVTRDLSDGTEAVGSEKLNCSFSVLEPIDKGALINKLWLVPLSGSDIIELRCKSNDIQIDNKGGDFEQSQVNVSCRYGVDSPAWNYIASSYYNDYAILLLEVEAPVTEVWYDGSPGNKIADIACDDCLVKPAFKVGKAAVVGVLKSEAVSIKVGSSTFWSAAAGTLENIQRVRVPFMIEIPNAEPLLIHPAGARGVYMSGK